MAVSLKNLFGTRYTLGELMSLTTSQRQQRSSMCSASLVNVFFVVKEESVADRIRSLFSGNTVKSFYMVLKIEVTSNTGHKHLVFIQLDPDFDMNKFQDNHVKIACDCPDFMYRSCYWLGRRGSLFDNSWARIKLGPAITNAPKHATQPTLCAHVICALNYVQNNYAYIMQSL